MRDAAGARRHHGARRWHRLHENVVLAASAEASPGQEAQSYHTHLAHARARARSGAVLDLGVAGAPEADVYVDGASYTRDASQPYGHGGEPPRRSVHATRRCAAFGGW